MQYPKRNEKEREVGYTRATYSTTMERRNIGGDNPYR